MPTRTELLNGINLACKYMVRASGPDLTIDPATGSIGQDWSTIVSGPSLGDAPIVCVLPHAGSIISQSPQITDRMGVTYTPVRLLEGLSGYKYFQPNNDYYAKIVDGDLTHDHSGFPKTTVGWVKVKFVDEEISRVTSAPPPISGMSGHPVMMSSPLEIMELEVRKITKWGPPLQSPEFEYQVKVNSYGDETPDARAVFLPDRLVESTDWTTIWKSSSSLADLGPNNPQRAAAVTAYAIMTNILRAGNVISSVRGLADIAAGIQKFYAQHNVTFEVFEGLTGFFENYEGDPHFIHSEEVFRHGIKTQVERPRYGWWWWPTRTGMPLSRKLYTSVHWPWMAGSRSLEALFYLFEFADTVPPRTESDDDGIHHCYEWLKNFGFDGFGLSRWFVEGPLADLNEWGDHVPFVDQPLIGVDAAPTGQAAHVFPNVASHPPFPGHLVYWADHLLRFAIVCGWLAPALKRRGDKARANEVRGWLLQSCDVMLSLQLPWDGVFVDDEGIEYCQVEHAGGLSTTYRIVDGVPRACRYPTALEDAASSLGGFIASAQRQQGLVPSPLTNHYELSIGVILAFALAYNIVDD